MNKVECFKIRILKSKINLNTNFEINKTNVIHDILPRKRVFGGEPEIIKADPFLFVYNKTLYLFYESKELYHDGVIMMESTKDLISWTKPVVVLKQSFHLSYPWVFEYQGNVYMMPETCHMHEIRVYRAKNKHLTCFEYYKTLLREDESIQTDIISSFCDSSIVSRNGKYYLFTTIMKKNGNLLYVYVADEMFGTYKMHPCAPVESSLKYGRNAGQLIKDNYNIYRVCQNCEKRYGDNVNVMKIEELTPNKYKEELIFEDILSAKGKFYKDGGHQYQIVEYNGDYVIATDAKEYHWFFINRVLHQFGCYR